MHMLHLNTLSQIKNTFMTKCPYEQSDTIVIKKGWIWSLLDKTVRCHLFSKVYLPFYIRYLTFITSGDNTLTEPDCIIYIS